MTTKYIFCFILVEHTLSIISVIDFIIKCQPDQDPVTQLVLIQAPHLFPPNELIPLWKAICAKFLSIIATFVWNYVEVFIIIICIVLFTHFRLFNSELERIKSEVKLIN